MQRRLVDLHPAGCPIRRQRWGLSTCPTDGFAVAAYDCTSYRHLPAACSGWDGCHHNCGLHWHHCGLSKEPAGLPFPMQSQLCPGLSPGGWLGSQTRHSLRSLSLQLRCLSSCQPVTDLNFRSPWSARISALPRERGEVNQPGCRCYVPKRFVATAASVVLALRLGSSFALNLIANFWLAYIRFVFGQYLKVSFSGFFSFRLIWCKTGAC